MSSIYTFLIRNCVQNALYGGSIFWYGTHHEPDSVQQFWSKPFLSVFVENHSSLTQIVIALSVFGQLNAFNQLVSCASESENVSLFQVNHPVFVLVKA